MSKAELLILELLDQHGELYGLELVKLSDGKLSRGVIYVDLSRLEDRGWVSSRLEDKEVVPPHLPRRLYKITPQGRRARMPEAPAPALLKLRFT